MENILSWIKSFDLSTLHNSSDKLTNIQNNSLKSRTNDIPSNNIEILDETQKQTKKRIKLDPFIKKIIDERYNGKGTTQLRLRLKVWMKNCKDNEIGKCYCCMKEIICDDPSWHCGHIIPAVKKGPKTIDNLQPICVKCNLNMSKQHMYQYMIYKNMKGLCNLPQVISVEHIPLYEAILCDMTQDKVIIKYNRMKNIYDNCVSLLNTYEESKDMPKYLINWWLRDIKTDNEKHLDVIFLYLTSYKNR